VSRKIVDKSSLLAKKNEERIEIDVGNEEYLVIYVKSLTFLDLQNLLESVVDLTSDSPKVDMSGFFDFAIRHWIVRTEPDLTTDDIKSLPAAVAQKIIASLPSLDELGEMLTSGFRN
tara:strand:+ start:7 stop:357 length:351 start_codon:yes stop_codon:yes gene_type:complete